MNQSCSKRSIVYETWCADCQKKCVETEGREGGTYKYIGESARSAYERGLNHQNDRKSLDMGSHMLKHALQCHENEDPNLVKFHMRILEFHKSSLERQISEAVLIQEWKGKSHILNSRSEYNRSSIPRLGVKMGQKAYKTKKEFDEEMEKDDDERLVEDKIRKMRKEMGKKNQRRSYEDQSSAPKRKKTHKESFGLFGSLWPHKLDHFGNLWPQK